MSKATQTVIAWGDIRAVITYPGGVSPDTLDDMRVQTQRMFDHVLGELGLDLDVTEMRVHVLSVYYHDTVADAPMVETVGVFTSAEAAKVAAQRYVPNDFYISWYELDSQDPWAVVNEARVAQGKEPRPFEFQMVTEPA